MKINKIVLFLLGFIVILLIGFFFFSSTQSNQNLYKNTDISQSNESQINYVNYSQENFKKASENGRAVLFFYAIWCSTCNSLDRELKVGNKSLPKDVTILKTDYDSEKELKAKYQITQQHTLVLVDKNGGEVKKWVGGGVDLIDQQLKEN